LTAIWQVAAVRLYAEGNLRCTGRSYYNPLPRLVKLARADDSIFNEHLSPVAPAPHRTATLHSLKRGEYARLQPTLPLASRIDLGTARPHLTGVSEKESR